MALVVEDGTGKADAESYVAVEDADAYHTARGNTAWTGATDTKEASLRRGRTVIDGRYQGRWPGHRTNGRAQALDWPRRGVIDGDGNQIADDEIPSELIAASCEAALRELTAPGSLTPDTVPARLIKRESKGVGPLQKTLEYADVNGAAAARPVVTLIDEILAPILLPSTSGSGRLLRA